ncbi:hypothetical protein HU719_017955 [Pseudomonas sp. SWRI107]|uniref:hypothetical protein n=1 Tax=Pseudomonas farsensis TaxID=2745492 RepID=UPI0016482980|nr:hypothetical protein [Pseudomonas farsensis]MBV4533281.1 hypothetical protein [Pseudomonas farsensis]
MEIVGALTEFRKILENPAVIGLGAAFIGGFFARHASIKAYELSEKRAKREALVSVRNSLLLISTEMGAAWGLYNMEYAASLLALPQGEPHMYRLDIGADTFTVYDTMASSLAEIDPTTAGSIVRTYMRMKGLVAMIETNNRYLDLVWGAGRKRLQEMTQLAVSVDATGNDHSFYHDQWVILEAKVLGMGSYADALKTLTAELSQTYPVLMRDIESAITKMNQEISDPGLGRL